MAPGYVERVAAGCRDERVRFTGYVAEEAIAELYRTASLLVLPYSSATGASGVAHLACEYGLPMVSAGIPDFRSMAADENLAIEFYRTGSAQDMADKVCALLLAPERQREMAEQNFSAALRMTMPEVVRQYLRTFEFQRRDRTLLSTARWRRLRMGTTFGAPSSQAAKAASRWSPWM